MQDIQEGTFDFVLTRPADAQALTSVREFRFWQVVDMAMGLMVLVWAAIEMRATYDVVTLGSFLLAILLGGLMLYSFWLMLTTIAFWVVRMDEMINLFEGLYAAGRWPVGIYPDWLKYSLTFLVPVAFAVTVPAEALTQRLTPVTLLGAGALTLVLLLLARLIWRQGLKAYSGASA
jgi:ABC-2 type transport system permease protein